MTSSHPLKQGVSKDDFVDILSSIPICLFIALLMWFYSVGIIAVLVSEANALMSFIEGSGWVDAFNTHDWNIMFNFGMVAALPIALYIFSLCLKVTLKILKKLRVETLRTPPNPKGSGIHAGDLL